MKKLGSVYLLALPIIMWHHISSHSLGHQSHCPLSWMPNLVCLLVGECDVFLGAEVCTTLYLPVTGSPEVWGPCAPILVIPSPRYTPTGLLSFSEEASHILP